MCVSYADGCDSVMAMEHTQPTLLVSSTFSMRLRALKSISCYMYEIYSKVMCCICDKGKQ